MTNNIITSFFNKTQGGKIIKIKLEEITTLPELASAFKIDSTVKDRIKADMVANGFSKAHPIHIFKWEEKWVLCDGHTRFTAAKELQLKHVWAQIHEFTSINQALLYTMKEQFNRRNIEDSELFKQFEVLRQEELEGHKLSAAEMSERLKKSKRHIFKLQEVFNKSSKEQLKAIREGNASINQVYNEIKKQEAKERDDENQFIPDKTSQCEIAPEIHDMVKTVEEKTSQQDEIVEYHLQKKLTTTHKDSEIPVGKKRDPKKEKISEKEIFSLGVKFALIEKSKGRTNREILGDELFQNEAISSNISFTTEDLLLLEG